MTLSLISLATCLLCLAVVTPSLKAEDPAAGKQVELELKNEDGDTIPYLLYLPKDYKAEEGKWPLMLFLHGRGESNGPLSLVQKWGPPRKVKEGESLSYVLVSPQCPRDDSWSSEKQQKLLVQLLDHIQKTYRTDEDRVYLTGLSMGGFGSWRLAADHSDRFAAVAPICGGGKPEDAEKLKGLPIWVFHGDQDNVIPLSRSAEMVEAIKKAGGQNIRLSTLKGVGHNSWSATYADPELYQWLNKQSRSANRKRAEADRPSKESHE